jgi:hypothetical protein
MLSLYSFSVCRGISNLVSSFCLSRLQNCFGLCLSMSGNLNCNRARPYLHYCTNCLYASTVCLCISPLCLTASRYRARAILHFASNHGAKCFAHLFGFLGWRLSSTVMTPAASASVSRNSSILAVRASLSAEYSVAMLLNASVNYLVDVCSAHIAALLLYSFKLSPSTQRYCFSSSRLFLSSAGVSVLGWPTRCSALGPPFSYVDGPGD